MPRTAAISDEQILAKLREAGEPRTAAQLGIAPYRLKKVEGVVVAGTAHTGAAGRPAHLFALA